MVPEYEVKKMLDKGSILVNNKPIGRYIKEYGKIMAGKGTQTRRNIVNKSLQLFSVKGYFNTSISDILEATDLTKGGLYGHFRSKEDIWYAVYEKAVTIVSLHAI